MKHTIDVELSGHLAVIRFHNPPLNYATVGLLSSLADTLEQLDHNNQVRAVVLTSALQVFCAGANLAAENGFGASGDDPLREFYDQALRIYACRKPIIAALKGAAIGAGLGLALAADFRVATPAARFSANFTKLGFHPGFGLTHTLPRTIGSQRAAEMFMTSNRYKTVEVAPWGLVDRIAEEGKLLETACGFANEIAVNAPLGLLATRATLRAGLLESVRAAILVEHAEQLKLQPTEDFAEGVKAMAERRDGVFSGR
ncbi:enoyl-CoA hydratase/isomerase family protein [Pseudomaricurvus sp. HS19]|uniref:enoyl-CoA hydratase/isomerase family protein n=1 Tax=Pseudomaricurvus sp. HS19 TaxID=2692626 RepID=UPI00136FAED9|nr:enoyl-CoA hydratase/isomerase family protein [Pseudomaricurvus sp. HS19]MYM62391.1 enoyl-CoA hydratase/isomerase family protein [Pseudomaricurvus sp. HS19]